MFFTEARVETIMIQRQCGHMRVLHSHLPCLVSYGSLERGRSCLSPLIRQSVIPVRRPVDALSIPGIYTRKRLSLSSGRAAMAANENGDPGEAAKLIQLKLEHRDIDAANEALTSTLPATQRQLDRLQQINVRCKD